MKETKPISIALLTAIFLICLLAMSIQSAEYSYVYSSSKDHEIESLKQEIETLRAEKEINSAGFNSPAVNILVILLFSSAAGIAAAYWTKRKTRSMCHCNNRRIKMLKKMKENLQVK